MYLNTQRVPFLALACVASAATLPAVAQTGDLGLVTAHLQAVTTMTAGFTQRDQAGKVLTGTLTLKRPGKIRFQYEKSVPILIVGDGKALTFIDYQVAQVQRWPIGNTPLGIFLDPARNMARFTRLMPTSDPSIVIVEARDPKRPDYGVLTLAFTRRGSAPGGLMLQGWVSLDPQGNRTTIRLANQQFNVAVSDQAFKWSDPRPKNRGR
jgi:outer membrane lipoprotein-sorting protein